MIMTNQTDQPPEDDDIPEVIAHFADFEELPEVGCNIWICQHLSPE
jgi:hypothetical protein